VQIKATTQVPAKGRPVTYTGYSMTTPRTKAR